MTLPATVEVNVTDPFSGEINANKVNDTFYVSGLPSTTILAASLVLPTGATKWNMSITTTSGITSWRQVTGDPNPEGAYKQLDDSGSASVIEL